MMNLGMYPLGVSAAAAFRTYPKSGSLDMKPQM
jgi:hypothetical protein